MDKKGSNPTLSKKEKVIVYLLKRLGGEVAGRKKLMKLMFLVEHYDPYKPTLIKKGLLDNTFIIYDYGVFSFEVMRDYTELIRRGLLIEQRMSQTENRICINRSKQIPATGLDETVTSRVDKIALDYGDWRPRELEISTLKALGISEENKAKYFGQDVGQLINARFAALAHTSPVTA